jgi:histidinol phosphatase-like PHP family hydrolase
LRITCDWHIHSKNSCDSAAASMAEIIAGARRQGIRDFGVTDHLHTPVNLPDLPSSRQEYQSSAPPARFHFGVEVSVVSQWELNELARGGYGKPTYGLREGGPPGGALAIGLDAREKQRLGVEYVIGGAHWPIYVPLEREAVIRDYHRQNMFLATHPMVDIVAHPWWWMGHWQDADGRYRGDPWLDDFRKVPQTMHEEFAAAVVEHGKAVEINIEAILLNGNYPETFVAQYLEYLAGLKERGVTFALGSDLHAETYEVDFDRPARMLESIGISDEDLWRLEPRNASGRDG